MGEWLLSRRDSTIVARHEVPGIMRKIAFVPGYYQPVPPGQKPFAHRSASSSPTTGLSGRAGTREVDVNRMTRITASNAEDSVEPRSWVARASGQLRCLKLAG